MVYLDTLLLYIKDSIAFIGVIVIAVGAIRSLYQLFMLVIHNKYSSNYIRLQFGNAVILGLEFMVGGDIIGSLVEPDYYNLGLLAIIVVIRTILSYFLNIELAALTPEQKHALK
ncbi:MAG: DUF1622 domain-containing protein [Candidatus Babeliales bacterium]|nr:DUF1622 domain-containing protein [Candidatus Babeliales bacterium]